MWTGWVRHRKVFGEEVTTELSWTIEPTKQKEGRVCVEPKSCDATESMCCQKFLEYI